jgi:anti-sigma factor RsiW
MRHLTDEQFEEILAGRGAEPEHLKACLPCRTELTQRRAVRDRLVKAFESVRAGDALAARVRKALDARMTESARPATSVSPALYHRRLFPWLAAAAAILIGLVPAGLFLSTAAQARAAQVELTQIHQANLGNQEGLFASQDPNAVTAYFRDRMGYSPALVEGSPSVKLRGCCVRQSGGRPVASYLIETPDGQVSIIVFEKTPQALGMKRLRGWTYSEMTVWAATCCCCNMAAVRMDGLTYYALGTVPHEALAEVLNRLPMASR